MQPRHRRLAALLGTAGLLTLAIPQPAGARSDTFIDGSGAARGTAIRLAPRTGGLALAVAIGDSIASYQGTEGRAQAQALDLGILGLLLTTVSAFGQKPLLTPDQLPGPVQANSSHGAPTATHSLAGGGVGASGGTETVTAHPNTSDAGTSAASLDLPGVLTVGAAVSHAETRLVPRVRREAHADVSIAAVSLAGGAVQLLGLHWDVTQHTGDTPVRSGGFHVDDIRVGGQNPAAPAGGLPQPVEPLVQSLDQANRVLATFGMHLTPPATRTLQDGTIEVGPLRISMGGTTQLSAPLGSALADTQPARDAVVAALKSDPRNGQDPRSGLGSLVNAGLLVADLAVGDLTGTGGVDVELGGVHATTEGIAYRNPFGDVVPLPALGDSTITDTTPAEPGARAVPPVVAPVPAPATTVITPATTAHSVATCLTTSPFGHPGCSGRDLARLAAGAALGVALLLFAGDAVLLHRRRRGATEVAGS